MPAKKLGIIAGQGALPAILAARFPDAYIARLKPEGSWRVGEAGDILQQFKNAGVTQLCLIGALQRPTWLSLLPSLASLMLILKHGFSFKGGDDSLLRRVRAMIEAEGFELVGVHTLCPDLLMPKTGKKKKSDVALIDMAHAYGRTDKGQSIVVVDGTLAEGEGPDGTNALIGRHAGKKAVLVKVAKPQQDLDLDMPVIGPETLLHAGQAGFSAIVAEAGKVILLDRSRCTELAEQFKINLVGVDAA